jgi:predicted ABC-type ATPase
MLNLYLPLADEAEIYDNSNRERVLIAEKRKRGMLAIHDRERWARIEEAIR